MFYDANHSNAGGAYSIGDLANAQNNLGDPDLGQVGPSSGNYWAIPWGQPAEGYLDLGQSYNITAIYILDDTGSNGLFTISTGQLENNPPVISHNSNYLPAWHAYVQPITARYLTFSRTSGSTKINEIAICGTPAGNNPGCAYSIQHGIQNKLCNNNNTEDNPNDDQFGFDLSITRSDNITSGNWSAQVNGITFPGTYGQTIALGPFPIVNGPVAVSVIDADDGTCTPISFSVSPTPFLLPTGSPLIQEITLGLMAEIRLMLFIEMVR